MAFEEFSRSRGSVITTPPNADQDVAMTPYPSASSDNVPDTSPLLQCWESYEDFCKAQAADSESVGVLNPPVSQSPTPAIPSEPLRGRTDVSPPRATSPSRGSMEVSPPEQRGIPSSWGRFVSWGQFNEPPAIVICGNNPCINCKQPCRWNHLEYHPRGFDFCQCAQYPHCIRKRMRFTVDERSSYSSSSDSPFSPFSSESSVKEPNREEGMEISEDNPQPDTEEIPEPPPVCRDYPCPLCKGKCKWAEQGYHPRGFDYCQCKRYPLCRK